MMGSPVKDSPFHQHKVIRIIIEVFCQNGQALFVETPVPSLHLFKEDIPETFQPHIQHTDIDHLMVHLKSICLQNRALYTVFFRVRQHLLQILPALQIQIYLGKVLICFGKIREIPQTDAGSPHHASRIQLTPVSFHGRCIRSKNLVFLHQPLGSLQAQLVLLHFRIDLRCLQQDSHILYGSCQDALPLPDGQREIVLFPKSQIMVTLHPDQMGLTQPVPVSFFFIIVGFLRVFHFFFQSALPLSGHVDGFLVLTLFHIEL